TASPIRAIFKQAFAKAGMPYFNPHGFRKRWCARSGALQNSGTVQGVKSEPTYEAVLTTFCSHGAVTVQRQAEIISCLASQEPALSDAAAFARAVARELREFIWSVTE